MTDESAKAESIFKRPLFLYTNMTSTRAMEEIPIWMRKPIKVEKPDSLITKYWKGQQSAEATKKKASGVPSLERNSFITNTLVMNA